MSYESVLVHTGVPVRPTEAGSTWIEGEPDDTGASDDGGTPGTAFDCCLFLPQAPEQTPPRGRRTVTVPTLLLAPLDRKGVPVDVSAADLLDVTAPELPPPGGGPDPVRWQVEGQPQPFGRPGDPIIGSMVSLKRVED